MSELLAIVPDEVEVAARELLELACAKELAIVSAESCPGGLVASLLTDVEGASRAFERGFVVYTDEAKCELLAIDSRMIERCGAVSRETAIAMAQGALSRSHGDVAIAITGFAGPAGPGDEPGLVHFACARSDEVTCHREEHFGDIGRGPVRLRCLAVAIDMLRKAIETAD
ncbi:CinA family protein [Sphingomonas sp. JC676]|uniref:CinA family protein n=1 Tax=Sphingomonas sp. JC676 TaxID=2768065 RepID=UPI0016579477|nr:CinA family protein [Sphingomonas sp. JC676]MBC9033844.1 CinA family protein [Sphingomonas sp. JC676]